LMACAFVIGEVMLYLLYKIAREVFSGFLGLKAFLAFTSASCSESV